MRSLVSVFLTVWLLFSTTAEAVTSTSAFSAVPARFRSQELTLGSRGLGEICYSRNFMPDGTVCNPAFLPEVKEGQLLARVFVGNGFAALKNANQFVNSTLTREYMQSLFRRENVISVEGHVGLSFTAQNFSAAFSPYRVQYASEIHNPNLPVVSVHAAIERSFVLGAGFSFAELSEGGDSRFTIGSRLRLLERKFVHGEFSLFQAATEEARDYLPSQKQSAVLLDPSIAFTNHRSRWKERFSLGLQNVGFTSGRKIEYPDDIDLFAGAGMEIPVRYGKVRIGLDFVDLLYAERFVDRGRAGASYKVGLVEVMVGANARAATAGLQYVLSFVQAGIVYEFVRNDLKQGGKETRLATELGFRL